MVQILIQQGNDLFPVQVREICRSVAEWRGLKEMGELEDYLLTEEEKRRLEKEFTTKETRYQLARTGQNIPRDSLQLFGFETIEGCDVSESNGFINHGYKSVYEKAREIAQRSGANYVLIKQGNSRAEKRDASCRNILYTQINLQLFNLKKVG